MNDHREHKSWAWEAAAEAIGEILGWILSALFEGLSGL